MQIQFLPQAAIDRKKWDACIAASGQSIYAYSFYLDHMARHWDALVLIDQRSADRYEAVMPLTWNRKFGISYLYQPFLTPQGGVFARGGREDYTAAFLDLVKERYRFVEINLNTSNQPEPLPTGLKKHGNYFLSLAADYASLSARFNNNLVRNSKKAVAAGCEYRSGIPLDSVLKLATAQLKQYTRLLRGDMPRFKRLCEYLLERKKAEVVGVFKDGKLIASTILFYQGDRAYYILAGNHPDGKAVGASHYLLQEYIRGKAGNKLILDFVGSDIKSVAFFYECFGASVEYYYSFRFNRLPGVVRLLKR